MATNLNYITITYGGTAHQIYRPPEFKPKREDVYSGEYTTCTGALIKDCVGWKFSDLTLEWDALPQAMMEILIGMNGECTMTFDDPGGDTITASIVRSSEVSTRHRDTVDGVIWWKSVEVEVIFLDVYDY
jgi:hypothetical protein